MNAQAIAQGLINKLMADFRKFPERMVPLGPIENLQLNITRQIALMEAQLAEAEKVMARMAEDKAALDAAAYRHSFKEI